MKALDLYKFIKNNKIEWHWDNSHEEVYLMPKLYEAKELNELLGDHIFSEEGIEVVMKFDYVCYPMKYICEYFDIELKEIFTENENDF